MRIEPDVPFRGSAALASGVLTRSVLYGPRFRRLFPDVHVTATTKVDFALLSRAAHVLVAPHGVLAGYSAAQVLGAPCAPPDAPAEVLLLSGYRRRPCPGLAVHRDTIDPSDVITENGLRVTTPACTAAHLARWAADLTEAVVAVDALCRAHELDPACVLHAPAGGRGVGRLTEVVRLADRRSQSPMESRIRIAIQQAGLPVPVSQHQVTVGGHCYDLDLAYPELKIAIEYNGAEHRTADRAHRDLIREQLLVAAGWKIMRFRAVTVLQYPRSVAIRVAQELAARVAS